MLTIDKALFLIETVGIPIAFFFLSVAMRRAINRPLTAGADWLLLLAAFDAAAVLSNRDLQPLIRDEFVRGIAWGLFLVLLVISIGIWAYTVGVFEKKLEEAYVVNERFKVYGWFGISWSIITGITAVNILIFTWKTT